jgi:DNA-binding HxlR family transcriptional regulator
MPRASFAEMHCSIARSLDLIGEWWTPLIIREALFAGARRFEDFQRGTGIARNILSTRLRTLVENGIFVREPYSEHPPRYDYVLTEKGRDLFTPLVALMRWGDTWLAGAAGPPAELVHESCGHVIEARLICSDCGQELTPEHVHARPPARASD